MNVTSAKRIQLNNRHLFAILLALTAMFVIAQETLSDGFLEYLSEYEEVDGEWVDPYVMSQELEAMSNKPANSNATSNSNPATEETSNETD